MGTRADGICLRRKAVSTRGRLGMAWFYSFRCGGKEGGKKKREEDSDRHSMKALVETPRSVLAGRSRDRPGLWVEVYESGLQVALSRVVCCKT